MRKCWGSERMVKKEFLKPLQCKKSGFIKAQGRDLQEQRAVLGL